MKTLGTWQYSPNYLELVAGNLQGGVVAIDGTNEYFNMNGWQNKGRVALGFNRDSRKYFTDEDADANRVFGVALSAQNGQFIIGSVPPGNSTTNGAVFFGKAE